MPPPPSFDARLVGARSLSPSVRELVFERTDARPMAFEPGQWVNVLLPPSIEAGARREHAGEAVIPLAGTKRSYSIASAPDGSARFEIAITRVQGGPVSTWLHEVSPGAVLHFSGPQGFFTRPPQTLAPSLMIATGTGVTPLRSMILAAMAAGSRALTLLVLGVRHEEDVLYADEFAELARRHPHFRFEATLSRPPPSWTGRRGYVQAHVRELWEEIRVASPSASDSPAHAYVCGLQRMVGSVRDLLRKEMALPREQVHSERYD